MYCTSPVGGQENAPVRLPSRDNFHLFLLAGQSNMAGRGEISAEDKKVHPRVFMLSKGGTWKPAVDPIHYDKKVAGVGLGKSFAIRLAQINEDISIGLVPAACGGSPISSWQPGGYHDQTDSHPYDDAIRRTRHALKNGVIKGILWHQGESDCTEERAPAYKEKLRELIDRFRKDLDAASVPFIIGQLGQFPERPWDDQKRLVNAAHISLSEETPLVGFVSSEALTCKQDRIHFDANSLRRFGRRYADVYLEIAEQGAAAEQDPTTPAYTFEKEIDKTIRYTYILHLPDGYNEHESRKWPLTLYLHGGGGKTDVDGYYQSLKAFRELPAILLAPLCPTAEQQGLPSQVNSFDKMILGELVDSVSTRYHVDASRRAVIGFSSGASSAWSMPYYHPNMFSKVVVMAGLATGWTVKNFPDIPVWVFSGAKDGFLVEQRQTVESALRWGVDVVYTVFPGADHGGAKREAMKIQDMLDWLTSDEDLRSPNARMPDSSD